MVDELNGDEGASMYPNADPARKSAGCANRALLAHELAGAGMELTLFETEAVYGDLD
ncbi:hypothetical protein ACFSHT_18585 [Paraburkholderia silviterrae]|uniref:hypothetical protein n=1 Tax=Paraburkholderia silviterrae TaxID=2528715 RepID=UPI001404F824|nr:hypothetical protein [Paraburkholderia silviterrae]